MIEIEEPSGFAGRGGVACAGPSLVFESPEGNECGSPSPGRSSTTEESSSIGNNSDLSATEDDGENEEVQSSYKGSLDSMDALEEVLPIRRGISNFYNGKSKSFTSLAEADSSVKEIVKPENAYSRRRRNLLAFSHVWDRSKGGFPYQRSNGSVGISKRSLISSSRSQLALAVAMRSSGSISSNSSSSEDSYFVRSPPRLPPLHPPSRASHSNLASFHSQQQDLSPWRSYSVVDLRQCASVAAAATAVPTIIADH